MLFERFNKVICLKVNLLFHRISETVHIFVFILDGSINQFPSNPRFSPSAQYVFVVMLVFVLEAGVGALARLYEEQVGPELKMNLNRTFLENYAVRRRETSAIDQMQIEVSSRASLEKSKQSKSSNFLNSHLPFMFIFIFIRKTKIAKRNS